MNDHHIGNEETRAKSANRVTWAGFLVNVMLTFFKLVAGLIGHSGAMIADAIHSLSDFVTDLVVLASFRMVRKPADKDHDYGHGKFETLASVFIGVALLVVGVGIFYQGAEKVYSALVLRAPLEAPGWIALVAAGISIVTKEWLYRYTAIAAKRIDSQAVMANAWHHRSDALSSLGTLAGIGGAILLGDKWRILDPLAAVVVSVFIVLVAWKIFRGGIRELLEESLDEETKTKILSIVEGVEGVMEPHDLRTRRNGSRIVVDIHVRVKNDTTIVEAHDLNNVIEFRLREAFGENTMISIHTEPETE
ncbi:MAG: cation transporter [Prolixibacteraceae bacterium]|jgi:cation diffusion facilitator family transporter|nr:cation transporter [Prolixibacteraceae bacterium]NLX27930.1 cation transporter [Bacteroidales bacterium]HNQ37538.1 cation diffusion facilitator family transporter [Prolixibacteraceae bacterium]HPJ77499.1 cation diffusion facilitator family transporter [Prolixibacteraceae bacterium]HRV88209.1 cation diffusion facilitator family transporter [Prolixibacteraceae bacterium]